MPGGLRLGFCSPFPHTAPAEHIPAQEMRATGKSLHTWAFTCADPTLPSGGLQPRQTFWELQLQWGHSQTSNKQEMGPTRRRVAEPPALGSYNDTHELWEPPLCVNKGSWGTKKAPKAAPTWRLHQPPDSG